MLPMIAIVAVLFLLEMFIANSPCLLFLNRSNQSERAPLTVADLH
jgi:hypothetical protein